LSWEIHFCENPSDCGIEFAELYRNYTGRDLYMNDKQMQDNACKEEKREYFRVEDLLPTSIKKLEESPGDMRGKTIPGLPSALGCPGTIEEIPDSMNPALWRILTEINQKLSILLDNMYLANKGLADVKVKRISLSETGLRVTVNERLDPGDWVEARILLTANTSYWVVVYGQVIRSRLVEMDGWEVAIEFSETGDEVRNAISSYLICRQRETIHRFG